VAPTRPSASVASPTQGGWGQPPLPAEQAYPVVAAKRDGARLSWAIQLGLGGGHDFTIRYANPGPAVAVAELKVSAADGTVMGSGRLDLKPAAAGAVSLEGIGMNAGDYTVTVTILSGSPQIECLLVK
jgi:beta-galactosidase